MTSLKQIEANRRNAENSTGPRSEAGKQRSSRNAVRHGLTAETVIEPLEDAKDYGAFTAPSDDTVRRYLNEARPGIAFVIRVISAY